MDIFFHITGYGNDMRLSFRATNCSSPSCIRCSVSFKSVICLMRLTRKLSYCFNDVSLKYLANIWRTTAALRSVFWCSNSASFN